MSLSKVNSKTSKKLKLIFLTILFIIASLMSFFGVRVMIPAVTNLGRGLLVIIPALLTYMVPLFGLIMFVIYHNTGRVAKRWRMLYLTGYITLLISFLNIILIAILIPLLFDGNIIFGGASKYYPLDVLLFNIIYLLLASSILLVSYLNKEQKNSEIVLFPSIRKGNTTFACFYLAFASYFFGEALFGFNYLVELPYVDPNWMMMIFVYFSFLLMPLGFVLYIVYFMRNKDFKLLLKLFTLFLCFNLIIFLAIIIIACKDPYIFSESLQYEFMIGYLIKFPIGLIVIAVWCILTSIGILIHEYRKYKREH